ncbi:MAG TPA: DUF1707 domain-containing protein [Micromonosporaceae bacterium]|jgi:hypothetical protein
MSVEPDRPQQDLVRASDAEREAILSILHDALSQGRITSEEYSERTAVVISARTVGELRPVISDLPVGFQADGPGRPVAGGDVVEWKGSFSSLKRNGVWQVPAKIVLRRRMGSVELDFTQAQFSSPVVEIEIDVVGGSIEMRVPADASVAMDAVDVILGSAEDHRRDASNSGRPHFHLHGTVKMGSLEIRGPKRRMFR